MEGMGRYRISTKNGIDSKNIPSLVRMITIYTIFWIKNQ